MSLEHPGLDQPLETHRIDFSRLLYLLYIDTESQLSRVDNKAQLVLSTNAVLAVLLANFGLGLRGDVLQSPSLLELGAMLASILQIGALFLSVYYALMAAFPRFKTSENSNVSGVIGLYYAGHIANMNPDEYRERFLAMTERDLKNTILYHIHAKSVIVQQKFINVRYSVIFIIAQLALWIMARGLLLLA